MGSDVIKPYKYSKNGDFKNDFDPNSSEDKKRLLHQERDRFNGGGTSLSDTISQKANDSDVVHKSGDEPISGAKGFTFISDRIVDGLTYGYAGDEEDAITKQKANLTLSSWNNIGMWSSYTNRYTIGFDVRNGNITANAIKSGPNQIDCSVEEQGDNYIRYANGLQMCWVYARMVDSVYTWSFPKTFSQNPVITATIHYPLTDGFNLYQRCVELNNISNTGVLLRSALHAFGSTAYAVGADDFNAIAIGKWK